MENGITLPPGWILTTLGEATKPSQKRVLPQNYPNLPYIGMENIEPHSMRLLGIVPAKEMKSAADSFLPGDVLYGRLRPYLNKVYCPDFEGLCSTEFVIFRKIQRINSKYLQYFLNSTAFVTFANSLNAGDRPRVKTEQLSPYPFPLPPLPEQERIVARIESLFTQLDAGVAALKRARAGLKRYKASVLKAACEGRLVEQDLSDEPAEELLRRLGKSSLTGKGLPELPEGWCWAKWEQLVSLSQNGFGKRKSENGKPTIVLRLADVVGNYISLDNVRRIGASIEEINKYELHNHDIICIRVNGSLDNVGRMILFNNYSEPVTFCDHFIRFRLVEPLLASFLTMYFDTDRVRKFVEQNRVSSAGQNTISQGTLLNFTVPLPPIEEQCRIVAEVEGQLSVVRELEQIIEANLKRAGRLRQAILKRAFEGRLEKRNQEDEQT